MNPLQKLPVLLTHEQIAARVKELGADIARDYAGKNLVLLPVLKGSYIFAADLTRAIACPHKVEFLGVKSYGDSTRTSGAVQITQDLSEPIDEAHVLLVEDIVDTGLTAHFLLEQLKTRQALSVKLCALLHKPSRQRKAITIDYLGFTIEDHFVVGYGLDHAGRFRHLRDLRVIDVNSEAEP